LCRVTPGDAHRRRINLDGRAKYDIKTGIGFLDHMLEQLSATA